MKLTVLVAAYNGEPIPALVVGLRIAEWAGGMAREVRLSAKARAVVQPVALHEPVLEISGLFAEGFLLAIGAVERIDVREEFLGDGLGDVPWRIAENRIESGPRLPEHVRELQLPMEEAHLGGNAFGHGHGSRPAVPRSSWGSGARSRWSAGQNQQAHHKSIAVCSERHSGEPRNLLR